MTSAGGTQGVEVDLDALRRGAQALEAAGPTVRELAHDNVRANAGAIDDWLHDPTRTRPARFDWDHGHVVGRSAPRDAASVDDVVDVSRSRVVLQKDPGAPLGYYIITSFPEP